MLKKYLAFGFVAFIVLSLFLAYGLVYFPYHTDNVGYEKVSPKGLYKVQVMIPSAWGFYYRNKMQDPGFARLYNNKTGKLMGESQIYEMSGNGQITWPDKYDKEVRVGIDIQFSAQPE